MGNFHSRHDGREQARIQQAAQEAATRETKEATERAVAEREAVVDYLRSTLPAHPDFPKKVKSSEHQRTKFRGLMISPIGCPLSRYLSRPPRSDGI